MPRHDYTELIAWRRAMDLAEAVYAVSREMPMEERFGLTAQIRRAAASVSANIAEGQGRRTSGEFLNSLSIAHGSVRELETQIMLAERLQFIDSKATKDILERAAEVGRLINGLANALKRENRQ